MKNKQYPLYEVTEVNNLKELVNCIAEKYENRNAFTFERNETTVSISYSHFKHDVEALSTELDFIGIKNEKIAVIGENSYEWVLTYFAAVNSGHIIIPLDKELLPAEIKNLIDHSGAGALVHSDNFSDVADYLKENRTSIKRYINMNNFQEMIERGEVEIKSGKTHITNYRIDNDALAAILYTSGTTGSAKGVMLSHRGLASNTVASCKLVKIKGSNLLVLPLHHSFGFTVGILYALLSGSEIIVNKSLKSILEDFTKYKPHNVFLVPLFVETFYKKIWDGAKKQGKEKLLRKLIKISAALLKINIDLRRILFKSVLLAFGGNLELIITGGAPIDSKYIQGLMDFGITALNGYGITECSPVVSVNRNHYYRGGSIGQLYPCCDVKILEPDERGYGEICVKGDNVMLGYYNTEQATKEAFDGEWFKTGDIGYLDKDGFLFILGRKKNLIILSNGKNVYPEELEFALLNSIPYIKEAVVFAENGLIVAEVFLDIENEPDCVSRLKVDINSFNQMQAPYKNIGKTIIRDSEFPKTTTKKIKRQY